MISGNPKTELRLIGKGYRRLEELARLDDPTLYRVEEEVSLWSIAEHLDHVGRVNISSFLAIDRLVAGREDDPEVLHSGGPKLAMLPVLLFGRIPRGRAQAPERFFPAADVERESVRATLSESRKGLSRTAAKVAALAEARGRIAHPILGNLNARQWLRFVRIHTAHHIRIMDDILAASAPAARP